ncbi:AMP-binding protein, partial [Aquisediminimonas sediminicola]|uniref:AMP-binding protein n=1 Tax=Alteraquisediminimonas sediminicola TaxID=2676787 RepID=UPI001C8D8219
MGARQVGQSDVLSPDNRNAGKEPMRTEGNIANLLKSARRHRLGDLLYRSAVRTPNKTAIVYGDLRQSFAALDDIVNRMANALAARGVGKGDHIAMLSHNNHAFVVVRFALARLGAVMVPINFMLNAAEVAYILDNAEACGLIAEDALVATADAAIAEAGLTLKLKGAIRETLQ